MKAIKIKNFTYIFFPNHGKGWVENSGYLLIIVIMLLFSCHAQEKKEDGDKKDAHEENTVTGTPVTLTTISNTPLTDYIDLNATSVFLQKNYIKANINGYVETVNAAPGRYVKAGETLFVLKTKEAMSLDNTVNKLDPNFKFSGVNTIKASTSGYITLLNHQKGDYVQDGEQLAQVSNENSFAFLLNLPYELRQLVNTGNVEELTLPDGTKLKGTVTGTMPTVDAAEQTLNLIIKVPGSHNLPESLIAKVRILKTNHANTQSLPKAAVLTNDVQSEFWIMELTDSTTAVKVPVKKGTETNDRVEILEPKLKPEDKILLTGNYGLPDTAKVRIVN